jgi:hypothetical protein
MGPAAISMGVRYRSRVGLEASRAAWPFRGNKQARPVQRELFGGFEQVGYGNCVDLVITGNMSSMRQKGVCGLPEALQL